MADYISVRLPADLAPLVEEHQRRALDAANVSVTFTSAVVALIRLGSEAARQAEARKPAAVEAAPA